MRVSVLFAALVLAGCSANTADHQAAANQSGGSVANAQNAAPAPSPDALAARQVAQRYFDLLAAKDYRGAYLLWGNGGADAGGSLAAFTKAQGDLASFEGKAGTPTAIRTSGGQHYILVEAQAVARPRTGRPSHRSGVVMLRRSADPQEADADKRQWRIWGMDVRQRRCRQAERGQALGCAPVTVQAPTRGG